MVKIAINGFGRIGRMVFRAGFKELDFVAVNVGASLSNDLKKWAIIPEYGILFVPGESGFFGQFSLGFSRAFGKN